MTILTPDHLLDQAVALLHRPRGGPRRQVDLRRAISAAYYSVFHLLTAAAADRIVGRGKRATAHYALVYRDLDHRTLAQFCALASRPSLPPRYRRCCPEGGFSGKAQDFARAAFLLQQQRHAADYDPEQRFKPSEAEALIDVARTAVRQWSTADPEEREAFLMLLMFPPR